MHSIKKDSLKFSMGIKWTKKRWYFIDENVNKSAKILHISILRITMNNNRTFQKLQAFRVVFWKIF